MEAFITVGGVKLPWPNYESGLQTQTTLVDGGRNGNGVFTGRRVGRDQSKVELEWTFLDAQLWSRILQLFEQHFVAEVAYYDMTKGDIITRKMYVGDRTAKPGEVDLSTGKWITAKNCKLNLIDTGA